LRKIKILLYNILECATEVSTTKLAALVLVCIVALAMAYSVVGFAFASKPIQPYGDPIHDPKPNGGFVSDVKPCGDAINDPKPNT